MRAPHFCLFAVAALLLSSCNCRRQICDEVVCERYVHPYGLEISGDEWCRQGSCGEVLTTRKDGVCEKKRYKDGHLDGETTYSFPHKEAVEKVETYQEGRLLKEQRNFSSGMPREAVEYPAEGEKIVRDWYDHGGLKSVEHFSGNRLKQGKYYNASNNVESSVENFYGKRTLRDDYGQLESVDVIEDGFLTSRTSYHTTGVPDAVTPYHRGSIHGMRKTFLPGGEPHTIEQWESGYQHGKTTVYEDGEKVAEIPYEGGRKNGLERRFKDESVVIEEISWQDGQRHGPTFRYVDGQVFTDWYFNGQKVSKAVYDKRTALLRQ